MLQHLIKFCIGKILSFPITDSIHRYREAQDLNVQGLFQLRIDITSRICHQFDFLHTTPLRSWYLPNGTPAGSPSG